ncbi:MAG: Peptidyl-prolyl cis-trans isomerase cyp8 [Bathelium mastoideum]|nr:MAG: Peptidyl-prolyl cis-trans isomerase cyp8 [Bathelium mastoideum]
MGKGTDKLYITHSEWSSGDQFSASAGANVRSSDPNAASFKRLPFNFCALSLQPFKQPVCTADGTVFDYGSILSWLKDKGTNPTNGQPLNLSDLIKLHFAKNDDGEHVDPVTYKALTDNTHITAIRHGDSANVFAHETVERLNIKPKNWRDLVSDEEFSRRDLITLQDPQNLASRDLSVFSHVREQISGKVQQDSFAGVNPGTTESSAKVLKAKEAIARSRAEREREGGVIVNRNQSTVQVPQKSASTSKGATSVKRTPYNAARYTTGQAAASFTSTGLTPHTSAERALLSDEEYMLQSRRVKHKGYATLRTSHGNVNLELYPDFAPRAVWNFTRLAQRGYYRDIAFHRNIRNFMIQGGDPTGTGRGGESVWGKPFADELEGPLVFDARGVLAMANKGKNSNSSQFFITYRTAKHLDRKHTIFGKVVDSEDVQSEETLRRLEGVQTDDKDRPTEECVLRDVVVFVDPFEEFLKERSEKEREEIKQEEIRRQGGAEDERTTWTGKRLRVDGSLEAGSGEGGGVGKYLEAALARRGAQGGDGDEMAEEIVEWDSALEPVKKKPKRGGFGNFDNW